MKIQDTNVSKAVLGGSDSSSKPTKHKITKARLPFLPFFSNLRMIVSVEMSVRRLSGSTF